jgi:predicted peptidase
MKKIYLFLLTVIILITYSFGLIESKKKINLKYKIISLGKTKKSKEIPIIIFLHGAGERGSDNKKQLTVGLPKLIESLNLMKISCDIVVPQCPENSKWVDTEWGAKSHKMSKETSEPLGEVIALVDSIIYANSKNKQLKIYLTGISMGGFGTWELLQRFPEKFKAAMPICGGADTSLACKLKGIPIWAFHGKNDKVVLPSRTSDIVNEIKKCGGTPKISFFEKVGHLSWDKVYGNPKYIKWLINQ